MPMPITRTAKLDFELAQMKASHRAAIKTAAETLMDAIEDEQSAYESPQQERIAFQGRVYDLLREMSHKMQAG